MTKKEPPRKHTVHLLVKVDAPRRLSKKTVAGLVDRLLNAGWEDAAASSNLDYDPDAVKDVLSLDITSPVVIRTTRPTPGSGSGTSPASPRRRR